MALQVAEGEARARLAANKERDVLPRAKNAHHSLFMLLAILYPILVAFSFQTRSWSVSHYSCPHPDGTTPSQMSTIQWDAITFMRTVFTFIAYTAVHVCLLGLMCLEWQNGHRFAGCYRWSCALVFFFTGFLFFNSYSSLTRCGIHVSDWVTTIVFSAFLLMMTVIVPLSTSNVIEPAAQGAGVPE